MTVPNLTFAQVVNNPKRSGYFFVRELTMQEWPYYLMLHEAREEHDKLRDEIYGIFYQEFIKWGCLPEVEARCIERTTLMELTRVEIQKVILHLQIKLRICIKPIVMKGEWTQ